MLNRIDKKSAFLFLAAFSLAVILLTAGCNNDSSTTPSNYVMYERYSAPEVVGYIDKYGYDFETSQAIESGKVYETMIWRSKGVSIKYLQETGQVVKEEHFSTYSTQR
ncbi:MAG TPA: hypothetical protein PKK26_11175 [Candidatus Wallbacteria bacterium]|nr:hypothetical protein [Candidatus Wallbacteria bacterium]